MQESLAPFHPLLVHAPIALIITSLVFELIGRATDLDWWRRSAFAMLAVGVLVAGFALVSGEGAAEHAVRVQGVPRAPIGSHENAARLTFWIGVFALAARALGARPTMSKSLTARMALVLHLAAAVLVGVTAYRGGKLVYQHAAGVSVEGEPVPSGPIDETDPGVTASRQPGH